MKAFLIINSVAKALSWKARYSVTRTAVLPYITNCLTRLFNFSCSRKLTTSNLRHKIENLQPGTIAPALPLHKSQLFLPGWYAKKMHVSKIYFTVTITTDAHTLHHQHQYVLTTAIICKTNVLRCDKTNNWHHEGIKKFQATMVVRVGEDKITSTEFLLYKVNSTMYPVHVHLFLVSG